MIDEILEVYQNIINDNSFTIVDEFGDVLPGKIVCYLNSVPKIQNNNINAKIRAVVNCDSVGVLNEDLNGDFYEAKCSYYIFANGFVFPKVYKNIFNLIIDETRKKQQMAVDDILIVDSKTTKFINIGNDENDNQVYRMTFTVRFSEKNEK